MTRKEAIQWYETKLAVNESVGLCGPQNEAAKLALAALREQEEREDNPALTMEELLEMHHKPVFVVPQKGAYESLDKPEWCVIEIVKFWWGSFARDALPAGDEQYSYDFEDYGTKWLAYRREPDWVPHESYLLFEKGS